VGAGPLRAAAYPLLAAIRERRLLPGCPVIPCSAIDPFPGPKSITAIDIKGFPHRLLAEGPWFESMRVTSNFNKIAFPIRTIPTHAGCC
jgi:hypothetical protein